MRGDLCRVLYNATKDRTTHIFGVSVTSFEQTPDPSSVTVHFSDSTSASYDLLVGADGQNSRLRRQMLGTDAPDSFKSLGIFASYFTVPRTPQSDKLMKVMQLPNRRIVATRCDNRPDLMQGYIFTMPPTEEGRERWRKIIKQDIVAQKAALVEDFADAGWEVPLILEGLETTPDFYAQEIGQVKTDVWSKGRVVLLGDAAHCPSPLTGMGTTSAFVGAYVLAGELSRSPDDIPLALKNYDTTLRPFVNEIQKINHLALSILFRESSTGVWLSRTILSLMSKLRIDKFLQAILPDERGGWVLPEYPAYRES